LSYVILFYLFKSELVFDSADVIEDWNITNHRLAACFVSTLLVVFLPSNRCKIYNIVTSAKYFLFQIYFFFCVNNAGITILPQSD